MKNMTDPYSQLITTKLKEHFMSQEDDHRKKETFWATESEASAFDLYHKWLGTTPTNPFTAEKIVMFSAAKMMELALVKELQEMGLLQSGEVQEHFQITRHGVEVSGYMDGIFTDGSPLEIKTVYGPYAAKELEAGKPKTSYCKQLAIYMDATGSERGKLIYMDRGTGVMNEFTLVRKNKDSLDFKCLDIEFDLSETYARWAQIYNEHILPKIELDPFENGSYKADISKIDWTKVSKTDISKARNGQKVIGSDTENGWKIAYSPFKSLIIERQGATLGYSEEEIEQIKELTKGYSSKTKA